MSFTFEPTEASKHVTNLEGFKSRVESEALSKAGESPNILAYGVFCMGVVGWWMQLSQSEAEKLVRSTGTAIDYCTAGMNDVIKSYDTLEDGHAEVADRLGKLADDVEAL